MHALLDTSALVAWMDRADAGHAACRELFQKPSRLLTTEAVLCEAMHLLSDKPNLAQACLQNAERCLFSLVPMDTPALARSRELMRRWADLPMDFADATLVSLAEASGVREIWTLDSDFHIYRIHGRGSFLIRPL